MSIPYIPLYVTDYEADTAHLSLEEDGAYMRLLRLCWRTPGCSVPDEPKWIMRKMRISADDYYRVVEPLIDEFFTRGMGRVFSPRLQREEERIKETSRKRSEAGLKGGRPAKPLKNNETTKSRAKAKQKHLEPELEPELEGGSPLTPRDILSGVLSQETADAFIEHRRAKRAKLTPHAAELIAKKLAEHPNPDAVVETSIMQGWTGVFPERNQQNGRSKPTGNDIAARAAERWTARQMDSGPRPGSSQPLLSTGQPDRRSGSGN